MTAAWVVAALSPVFAGAATMGTISMGAMQSDLHQQMDCGGADTQEAFHSNFFKQTDCSDREGSGAVWPVPYQ